MTAHTVTSGFRGRHLLCALFLALSVASGARAQTVQVAFENDLIGIRGSAAPPDRDYTSGLRLGWRSAGGLGFTVAQEIYTPKRDGPEPVPGERPFAGWLYGEVGWRVPPSDGRGLRELAIQVGLVGPGAGAEEIQTRIHELTGSRRVEGWSHQLSLGPSFAVRARDGLRLPLDPRERWSVQPYGQAVLGTVRTSIEAGAPFLFRMDPTLRKPEHGLGAGLAVAARWTLRDALLDEAPNAGEPVDRIPLVAEGTVALGYRLGDWSLTYAFALRSREYDTQRNAHGYGALTLTWTGR